MINHSQSIEGFKIDGFCRGIFANIPTYRLFLLDSKCSGWTLDSAQT